MRLWSPFIIVALVGAIVVCTSHLPAQEVAIDLFVNGPGVVSFGTPRPHTNGQTLELFATPLAGAQFVSWSDGVFTTNRTITVSAAQTTYTANFAAIPFNSNPDFTGRALDAVATNNPPHLHSLAVSNGRVRIVLSLPGKHGYRLLNTGALKSNAFAVVAFATNAISPVNLTQYFGGPGIVTLWAALPSLATNSFYQLQLDNAFTVPVLFFSDVSQAAPGADVNLYGDNLTGAVTAQSGATSLSATPIDDERLRVLAPGSPGQLNIDVRVNAIQALGTIPLTVVAASNAPSVDALPSMTIPVNGLLRITGTGFGTNTQVWLGQQLLQVVGRATNGTEIYVKLPAGAVSGRLNVVSGGVRSISRNISVTRLQYRPAAEPVAAYAFISNSVHFAYTPGVQPVAAYAFQSNAVHFNYTPGVQPVSAYTFQSNSIHFGYTPGVQPAAAYAFVSNSVHFSYLPGVQPVRVQVP